MEGQVVTEHKGACCSSPAAVCYRFAASLVAWGILGLIGLYWHALSAATILFAMAIGCVANWLRNRTLHCAITGPLFLLAAVVFLLSDLRTAHVNSLWFGHSFPSESALRFYWNGAMRSVPHRSREDANAFSCGCHLLL
jgi:hypothetical protein